MTYLDRISDKDILDLHQIFIKSEPYNHIIIDDFLDKEIIDDIVLEFPNFDDEIWYNYDNPLEIKKASNNWNIFGSKTYQYFTHVLSQDFTSKVNLLVNGNTDKLYPDVGLHGGGYHSLKTGGKLNPHLDYSIHPKLGLQRIVNIILYVTPNWKPEWGGTLGLWSGDNNQPNKLEKKVDCIFNRAIIFNTIQNSWHGISNQIKSPDGITRNSLATYYLHKPTGEFDTHMRVRYAPTEDQKGNKSINDLINKRQSSDFNKVYRTK
jgi:2OG-Fe(II) oxygenase superfamily